MKADLVRIGNSRGIRIPKPLIEECGFRETVELRVENNCLVISREHGPRQDWEAAFQAAGSSASDELLLDGGIANAFDAEEWQW
jgi:antitoxin MazE